MRWQITNLADRQTYKGRGWESIANRVWGRTAEVRRGDRVGEGVWQGLIVKRAPGVLGANQNSYVVVTNVVLRQIEE